MLSLVASTSHAQRRGAGPTPAPDRRAPGLTPDIKTLADGTRVTTYRDDYGLVRVQREFPNHTIEVENYKAQTRTIMWPDGATDEMPIDVHARWTTNKDGSRANVDMHGRILEVQYPDGSSMRFDYEKFSPSNRVLGVTVRGPASEGSPILQQMTRPAYSQDFKNPNFKQIADAEAKKRFDFTTRDADGKVTTTTADAYYDPKTNALTLSNALETTRLYGDGTRQVDDNLQGTTRTFDANGRITKIETNPGNRNTYPAHSATVAYDDKGLSKIDVAGVGTIERQPDGSWKLPDGTKVNGELVVGKGIVTIVGPGDASGNRRVDQFRFDDQENGWQKFTQGADQAKYLDEVAKKLGAGDGAQGAATVMELLEATQRAQDARDRRFSDAINTAAYKLNGERPDGDYPADLKAARRLSNDVQRLLREREELATKKDYKGLATSDLTKRINETEDAAREKLEQYIPTLGEVAQRIIDDLPAKIGGGINYAIEHPFKTAGGLALGLAASIIAPELALAVGVGSLGINTVKAGGEIISGYVNHDPGMVWRGADGAGDAVLEGGNMLVMHAAFKGLGALGKPIAAKLLPKRVVPETFPAAKMEGAVRAPGEGVVTETPGVTVKGAKGGAAPIDPRRISLPIIEPPPTRCFVAGTQVLALGAAGIAPKNIEEISEGDVVVSQDVEEGEMHLRAVTHTFAHVTHDLRVVTARDAAGHEQSIETTDGHRFFAEGLGFVRADALVAGTHLRTGAESSMVVSSLPRSEAKGVVVYNFEVESDHDYFVSAHAGDVAVLVHNDCIDNVLATLEKTDPFKAAQARKGLVELEGSNQSGKVKELLANLADNNFKHNQAKAEAEVIDALVAVADGKQVVATPWGLARQDMSDSAIAARVEISGQGKRTVYRLGTAATKVDPKTGKPLDGSEGVDGQFWARENPITNPNYARDYGIPQKNIDKADFIEVGEIIEGTPYITRPAPPSPHDPHLVGGGIEVVVAPNGVKVKSFSQGKGGVHDLISAGRPGSCATPAAPPH